MEGSEVTGMEALTTDLVSGLTTIQTDLLGALGDIAPVALVVMGGVMLVRFGVKIFRSVAK